MSAPLGKLGVLPTASERSHLRASSSEATRVALVAMPFGPASSPALGLSSLAGVLRARGTAVTMTYGTIAFARAIGMAPYDAVANAAPQFLLGDWVFANTIAEAPNDGRAYVRDVLRPAFDAAFVAGAVRARTLAAAFIDEMVDEILASDPHVVGFTTTFAQTAATLGAARALKARRPEIAIVLGGANCEGEMAGELARRFPFVDAVVSGEGEAVVCDLVERLRNSASLADLAGVYTRSDSSRTSWPNTRAIEGLDTLPYPDFDDFFAAFGSFAADGVPPRLLIEASRGCWWGEKQHCTFCGLNGAALGYRSKSPERFVAELEHLIARHGVRAFSATDNILDYRYFSTALPMLVERRVGAEFFFEVKANLRRAQMEALVAAGVRRIQPGIESLDSGVLRLMRKGVSGIANVYTLKLCREYGMSVAWNLIHGFPDEEPDAYARMARLLPLLAHFTPPDCNSVLRMDRFSPLYDDSLAFGLSHVRPASAYAHVFDDSSEVLRPLAYYFDFDYADGRDVASYTGDLARAADTWRAEHATSDFSMFDSGDALLLVDRRTVARRASQILTGVERAVYLACADVADVRAVESNVAAESGEVARACARFVAEGLMIEEAGKVLSLAVNLRISGPSDAMSARIEATASKVGLEETLDR